MEVCHLVLGVTPPNFYARVRAVGGLMQKFVQPLAREAYTCYSYSRTAAMYIFTVSR